jgi:hypothetical protein
MSFAMRIWRHLKQLRRAGKIYDPQGVENIEPGELNVKCPACPDPDRNLPEDWEEAPECDQ